MKRSISHNSKQLGVTNLLNEDNTFFNCVDFTQIEETKKVKPFIKQKFSALSLKKNNGNGDYKELLNSDNTLFDSIDLDEIENKQKRKKPKLFLSLKPQENAENEEAVPTRPERTSDEIVERSPKKFKKPAEMVLKVREFDAFQNYLQFDTQSCNNQKEPTTRRSIEDLVNNSARLSENQKSVGNLFDKLEHSITVMGNEDLKENELEIPPEVLDALLATNKAPTKSEIERGFPSMQSALANVSWSQNPFCTPIPDASFTSAMKLALLANASKTANITQNINSSLREEPVCQDLGPFFGMPLKVKDLIKLYKGIEKMYDWQNECLNLPAINSKKNLIYALPTSGGKTLVAEILMLKEILCYKKNAVFVLPYVAIVQEKVWSLSPFAVALDFLVEEYAASKGTYPPRKRRRKNSIYIATIEKALGMINSLIETGRINELGLIVVDELHLIGEQGRGATLEALLTKLIFLDAKIQIVGMSATIGNVQDLCEFLDADIYTQNFRPVELIEYIKCGSEIAKINTSSRVEELFTVVRKTEFEYSESLNNIDPDRVGGLVMEVIPQDSCLIFCPSKKNCENVAFLLCKVLSGRKQLLEHRKNEKEQIKHALKDESGSLCKILKVSVQFGIAYHHSGLTNEERRVIEDGFRAGIISVICCTSTLAAGVNLPAKRVILRQPYVGRDFITLSKYKQMVGRAGRAGLGETGESILMCSVKDLEKVRNLLLSPMDQAISSLHKDEGRGLRHLLLSCISLGIANTRRELQEVTKKTLVAVQKDNLEVDIKRLTDKVIKDLFKLGALQEADLTKPETSANVNLTLRMETSASSFPLNETAGEIRSPSDNKIRVTIKNDTKLVISKLGCAAIRGNFELTRAHMLYDDLHQAQKSLVLLDALHLLYLVTPYDLAEQIRPNKTEYYNIFNKLGPKQLQTANVLGINESVARQLLLHRNVKSVPERILNRFYLTLMLHDLWNETPVFEVSEKFQIDRGIVQNLMTSSATFAANVVAFCEGIDEFWSFSHLLKGMSQRLSHCCVKELLPLMELPAVKQSRAKQLFNAGFKTLQSIAKATVDSLVERIEFLPRRVASQLIAASKMLLLEKVENLREEAEDVLEGKTP